MGDSFNSRFLCSVFLNLPVKNYESWSMFAEVLPFGARGPVIMVHRIDVIITNCISVAVRLMLPNISLTEYARIVTVPTCHVLVVDCPRPI